MFERTQQIEKDRINKEDHESQQKVTWNLLGKKERNKKKKILQKIKFGIRVSKKKKKTNICNKLDAEYMTAYTIIHKNESILLGANRNYFEKCFVLIENKIVENHINIKI